MPRQKLQIRLWNISEKTRYNSCAMRILSIRPVPVAKIFTLAYALCGLIAFIQYQVTAAQTLILPIGILMGFLHLNINIQAVRSDDLLANVFLCFGAIFSYALSGWITGIAAVLCFNLISEKMGGIEARLVADRISAAPATPPAEPSQPVP